MIRMDAVAYRALREYMKPGEIGIFLETAHPAKFKETVEDIVESKISLPEKLAAFMKGEKQTVKMSAQFPAFKKYLLSRQKHN